MVAALADLVRYPRLVRAAMSRDELAVLRDIGWRIDNALSALGCERAAVALDEQADRLIQRIGWLEGMA
jgi:hypothetical protein